MRKRELPRHCRMFFEIAKSAKLSYPFGRALYACNGIQNGRFRFSILIQTGLHPATRRIRRKQAVETLKVIRVSTAQRWIHHWRSGGSIKSLSHGSMGRLR